MEHFQTDTSYLKKAAEQTRVVKETTYRLLDLPSARSVCDLGCGPGIDTIEMGKRAHPDAKIIGVDFDPEMVKNANESLLQTKLNAKVTHVVGSVENLPFNENEFDRVRAERLFQVIPPELISTETIMGEINRILQPGGIVVLADTDWATASMDFSDRQIERTLIHFFGEQCRPRGFAGKELFRWMKQAGFKNLEVELIPIPLFQLMPEDPLAEWLTGAAKKAGILPEDQIDRWLVELYERSNRGELFGSVNMNIFRGEKL